MPFDIDPNTGSFVWKGDDSDWLGSPTVAAPSLLDAAMQAQRQKNLEAQAKATDNWAAQNIPQQGGLAQATASAAPTPAPSYGATNPSGAYAGVAVPNLAPTREGLASLPLAQQTQSIQDFQASQPKTPTYETAMLNALAIPGASSPLRAIAGSALGGLGAVQGGNASEGVPVLGAHVPLLGGNVGGLIGGNAGFIAGAGLTPNLERSSVRSIVNPEDLSPKNMAAEGAQSVDAVWHNGSSDVPVKVNGVLGQQNGETFYSIEGSSTGIPGSQLEYAPPAPAASTPPVSDVPPPPPATAAGAGPDLGDPNYIDPKWRGSASAPEDPIAWQDTPAKQEAARARLEAPGVSQSEAELGRRLQEEAAQGRSAPPAGAGPIPAAMTNRGEVPFRTVNEPNLPGLVDAEKFGVAQAFNARVPNIPTEVATEGQIRSGLYNAGFEPTVAGMRELRAQGIPDLRSLYGELDRQGIKLPQEEPPSGMPDAIDQQRRFAPQNQEAAARNGAPPETPPQGFREFMDARGGAAREYQRVADEMGVPTPRADSGGGPGPAKPQMYDRNGVPLPPEGGRGNGGEGTPPTSGDRQFAPGGGPQRGPFPTREANIAEKVINEITGLIRLPQRTETVGPHQLRIGTGLELSHLTRIPEIERNWLRVLTASDPEGVRAAVNNRLNSFQFIGGEGLGANMPGRTFNEIADRYRMDTVRPRLGPSMGDKIADRIPGVKRNTEATFSRLEQVRKLAFNDEAMKLKKVGITDQKWYDDIYQKTSHASGIAFSKGNGVQLTGAFMYSPSAILARFATAADLVFGTGAPLPWAAGGRAIALKALMMDAASDATVLGISKALGANLAMPTATNLTSQFIDRTTGQDTEAINTKLGKAFSGRTSVEASTGYLTQIRLFGNLVNDFNNGDRDSFNKHVEDGLRGQAGALPGMAYDLARGQDYAGKPYGPKDALSFDSQRNLWGPFLANSMWDALTIPGGSPPLALWGLGAATVHTSPATDSFTSRMGTTGLSGKALADIQYKLTDYWNGANVIKAQGGSSMDASLWQSQYLKDHPEARDALQQAGYALPTGPLPYTPSRFTPGNLPYQPSQFQSGEIPGNHGLPYQPSQFQQGPPKPTPTFTPRNKQPVPAGAR